MLSEADERRALQAKLRADDPGTCHKIAQTIGTSRRLGHSLIVQMRLLVYEPTDCQPRNMAVDEPPGDALLRQAVGGEIEDVPGFNSIFYEGDLHRCVAFCNEQGKDLGLAQNAWATALWHASLKHQGYERGLRREDGTVADRLVGNVVIVFDEKASGRVKRLAKSPAIVPTSETLPRESCREIDLVAEAERLFKS
jgi:hypothetical protein